MGNLLETSNSALHLKAKKFEVLKVMLVLAFPWNIHCTVTNLMNWPKP
jgi:hypothetical protein